MIKSKSTIIWNSYYTPEQCKQIEKICLTFPEKEGVVQNVNKGKIKDEKYNHIRRSKVRFVKIDGSQGDFLGSNELYQELYKLIDKINTEYFKFDITGIDSIQYTEYDGEYEGHYDWHTDWNWTNPMNPPRKLSMTIQLSSGDEYEGGDFEIAHDLERGDPNTKTLGTVICFPSFMPHKVHPVMQGLRKSLVVWFTGPRIK